MTVSPPSVPPYSETLLADLENRLLWARDRIGREFARLAEDTLAVDPQRTFERPSERGADEYAQSVNVGLLQNDADALWQIEEALDRVQGRGDRPYGLCQHCAVVGPKGLCPTCPWIPDERLIAIPWATHCTAVQERLDRHELVPAEVEIEDAQPSPVVPRAARARVRALDRGVQHANIWIARVLRELACEDREHAFSALRRTLPALRDELPLAEAAHMAAQMPLFIRGMFYEGWRPGGAVERRRSRQGFLDLVARGSAALPHPAEAMARAVFRAIADSVSAGEVGQVQHVLPRHVRELWPGAGD